IEEFGVCFPPRLIFRPKGHKSFLAILGIALNKIEPSFRFRQRRGADINSQHVHEPEILTDTLVDHVLVNAAPTGIGTGRPNRQIVVLELAPDAHQLQALSVVSLDQKIISRGYSISHTSLPPAQWIDSGSNFKVNSLNDAGW